MHFANFGRTQRKLSVKANNNKNLHYPMKLVTATGRDNYFYTWNMRPQQVHDSSAIETLLKLDAAISLKNVSEIIENLWPLIEKYEKQVNNHDLSTWFRANL
ncbi:uncharacterized protein LOC119601244 [Lucilia sericata]|uniref:uncharacterized protein LOC119601242 n=1 Tax=Lucilia sericata TaxID=13632 RepID=UPI0018A84F67|nr:uncharacterized protein LOC119601242 [Lucilia sericata]XP_037807972.1 uncharacterized protein LOC119601244 [Lucilia sericata]